MEKYHRERLHDRQMKIEGVKTKCAKKGAVDVIKAVKSVHGFDGWIARFAGHPDLATEAIANELALPPVPVGGMEEFMKAKAASGSNQTLMELLEEWNKLCNPQNAGIVTAGDEDSLSSVTNDSTVTDAPAGNNPAPAAGATSSIATVAAASQRPVATPRLATQNCAATPTR